MELVIALIVVLISVISIFQLNTLVIRINIRLSDNDYLNNHAKYQAALFLLAVIVLFLVYVQNHQNFWLFCKRKIISTLYKLQLHVSRSWV